MKQQAHDPVEAEIINFLLGFGGDEKCGRCMHALYYEDNTQTVHCTIHDEDVDVCDGCIDVEPRYLSDYL